MFWYISAKTYGFESITVTCRCLAISTQGQGFLRPARSWILTTFSEQIQISKLCLDQEQTAFSGGLPNCYSVKLLKMLLNLKCEEVLVI